MAQIVKPEVLRRLKRRAAARGRSLQGEVATILEQVASMEGPKLARKELIAKLEQFRKRFKGRVFSDSTKLIRQDRYR